MQFTFITAAAIFAGMALAAPTDYPSGGSGNESGQSNMCAQYANTKPSCCATESVSSGGLIGGIADGLLGGSCTLNILGSTCSLSQTQACCPTSDQTGLVNVGSVCIPVSL